MRRSLFAILVLLSVAGCGLKNNDEIPVINVAEALGTYRAVPTSELIAGLEYIPLETGGDFLVGRIDNLIVTDDRIFVSGPNYCYAFTRDGKYLTNIGKVGRGPGEYNYIFETSVNEDKRSIYIVASQSILEYSWDNEFKRAIEKPVLKEAYYGNIVPEKITFLRDTLFLGHIENNTGQESVGWLIFDDNGSIVKTFPQTMTINKEDGFVSGMFGASKPHVTTGGVWMKEILNDTIFRLDRRGELVQKFVLDLGEHAFPRDTYMTYNSIDDIQSSSIHAMNVGVPMMVTDNDVFFSLFVGKNIFRDIGVPEGVSRSQSIQGQNITISDTDAVLGLYDIVDGRTKLLDRDPLTRRLGLVNDIDGGLSFWPRTVSSAGELVDVWDAFEMKDMLDEEYFGAHKIGDPAANERLRKLLEGLEYDDNPVIVIAKLKK